MVMFNRRLNNEISYRKTPDHGGYSNRDFFAGRQRGAQRSPTYTLKTYSSYHPRAAWGDGDQHELEWLRDHRQQGFGNRGKRFVDCAVGRLHGHTHRLFVVLGRNRRIHVEYGRASRHRFRLPKWLAAILRLVRVLSTPFVYFKQFSSPSKRSSLG